MVFPYVDASRLELELQYTQTDFASIQSESDWNHLLTDAVKSESERVEGDRYADRDWRDADEVPFVVQECVIRLARNRIANIKEDGLSSEDLASGAGYEYRPPQAIRGEVRRELRNAGYGDSRHISST